MLSLKNYKYLKASSLLESVIAISIISICILVAFSIYVNVTSNKKSVGFYNAKHKVEELTNTVLSEKDYEDDEFKYNGFKIKKNVDIDRDNNLVELNFQITTSDKTYIIHKILPYIIENED